MTLTPETTTTLSAGLATYFDPKVLKTLEPKREHANLCTPKVVPENAGKTVSFLTYSRLSGSTTALTEGTSPSSTAMTTTATTATMSAWAACSEIEDFVVGTVCDDVVANVQKRLAECGLNVIDLLIRNAITAGSTKQYASAAGALSAIDDSDNIDMGEIRLALRTMETAFADPMSDGFFHCVIHPYQKYDLLAQTATGEWNDIHKYTEASPLKTAELGTAYGVKFYGSSNVYTTTSGTSASHTAYYAALAGRDGIASISLKRGGGQIQKFYKEPQFGVADPGAQFHMAGIKIPFFVPKVINASEVLSIVTGATV